MAHLLKLGMPPVKWETSRSCLFSKARSHSIVSRWRVSDGYFSSSSSPSLFFLLHILDLFLLSLIDILFCFWQFSSCSSCCFLWFGWSGCCFSFFLLQIHEEEEKLSLYQWKTLVPLAAPLSRHCGSFFERLVGFSLFKVQMYSFLRFSHFFFLFVTSLLKDNGFWVVRRHLHEIPILDVFSQKALKTSFKSPPSSFSAHSSRFSGDVFGVWKNWVGTLEFMKTWSRERQRVGSRWEGWKDDWVGSWAWLKDGG